MKKYLISISAILLLPVFLYAVRAPSPGGGSGSDISASSINDLNDVDASTATAGNVMTLRGDGSWVGATVAGTGDVVAASDNAFSGNNTMSGPLTLTGASSMTIRGDGFSVGTSTFTVSLGKVGIGTTAPGYMLDLLGPSITAPYQTFRIGVRTTDIEDNSSLILQSTSTDDSMSLTYFGPNNVTLAGWGMLNLSASSPGFLMQTGGGFNFSFTNTGFVGMGTTAPSYNLHVSTGASTTGTIFAVSTGTIDLFAVHGTSVSFEVPLVLPDGTVIDDSSDLGSGSGDMLLTSTQTVSGGKVHTSFLTVRSSTMQITAAAGANVNTPMFAVSTGSVNVFSVMGGSINVKVPFVWPDGSIQTSAPSGTTQWTTSGSNIGYTGGKVGVGITNPSASLHVSTAAGTTTAVFAVSTGTVDLFKVSGASISVNAPMYVSAAIVGQGTGNGSISLDGNTVSTGVVTAVGFEGSASSLKIGPSGNTNQILVHSTGTTISSNGKSTGTWTATNIDPVLWTDITISSDSLAAGGTFWMLTAPSNSAITITSVVPLTYSVAASSANFSLQEKVTQNANGSQIFTGTYSTGTWNHMNPITSFADSSIAAGSSVFLVTKDGGATAGTPRALSVILYYKYATP